MKKNWPTKRDQKIEPTEAISPVSKYINSRYHLALMSKPKKFKYSGLDFGKRDRAEHPDIEKLLSSGFDETLNNPLNVALYVLFMLGVEQGRRDEREHSYSEEILRLLLINRSKEILKLRAKVEELEKLLLKNPKEGYASTPSDLKYLR